MAWRWLSGSAVGGGTNHHEGLVHSDVGHEERQKGHQHKPGRPKPLHEARHGLVQDQIAQHQFPPSARHQGLAPSELGRLRWFQLGLLHPQVGAWMEHIKGNPESQGPNSSHEPSWGCSFSNFKRKVAECSGCTTRVQKMLYIYIYNIYIIYIIYIYMVISCYIM